MLFTKGLIKLFVINLKIFNYFGSYLYNIDPATYKLNFNNSKRLKIELISKWLVAALMYAVVTIQLVAFGDVVPSEQYYEGIFFVSLTSVYLGTMYVYYSRNVEVLELFNSLVKLEKQLLGGMHYI